MNRQDWIWIFLKAFGIYLLINAVIDLPYIIYTVITVVSSSAELGGYSAKLGTVITSTLLTFGLRFGAGLYFILSGRYLLRLIFPATEQPSLNTS
jgi:hypothetical protein